MALDVQSGLITLFLPHFRGEVWFRVDYLVFALVDVQASFFHLHAKLSHHNRAFCFVLIRLDSPLTFLWVVGSVLICLSERMEINLIILVVFVSSKVRLLLRTFFNFNLHGFSLVILQQNIDREDCGHLELIRFN